MTCVNGTGTVTQGYVATTSRLRNMAVPAENSWGYDHYTTITSEEVVPVMLRACFITTCSCLEVETDELVKTNCSDDVLDGNICGVFNG